MEYANWKLIDRNVIVIQKKNEDIYVPSSKEIFLAEFKSISPLEQSSIDKPSVCLPHLSFSKIPIQLKLSINNEVSGSEAVLILNLSVISQNKQHFKLPTLNTVDYIILNDKWFPFEQGALEEIRSVLDKAGIPSLGRITFKNYLSLKNSAPDLLEESELNFYVEPQQLQSQNDSLPLFKGTLYPYQLQGYRWLKMISTEDAGCILADEMGLGKTAQIIAMITTEKFHSDSPCLVIAPVSLMENWKREVIKFSPDLNVYVHQGSSRTGFYQQLLNYDIVVTNYDTAVRDLSMLQMIHWNLVILDEAQAIKNPTAKRSQSVKQIPRRSSIAVTGTPLENKLSDLWSLMDFSFPGYLGSLKEFELRFNNDVNGARILEKFISPLMLRRRVKDVAKDLPARIDIPQILEMNSSEIDQYEILRQEIFEEYGKNASLISLVKLRMFCSHPILLSGAEKDPSDFIKYQRMIEIIEEIIENKEKVLIFTSFTRMTDIMIEDLPKRFEVYCDFIDGRVPVTDRQAKIDEFTAETESAILILNPRAAGAGLNITAANHVIHYNLEWNPAVEDQASARAYRRGQTRPVNVYRLFYADTVEEAINLRLDRKREIFESAIIGNNGEKNNYDDILKAMTMTPKHGSGL